MYGLPKEKTKTRPMQIFFSKLEDKNLVIWLLPFALPLPAIRDKLRGTGFAIYTTSLKKIRQVSSTDFCSGMNSNPSCFRILSLEKE